ncbi:MAG: methionyl-tRNA formyltransferase [Candidatus Pacebacteria bacterium]|nr:methionyl-tRNA formyltransferase [Candidatus Paceibacterota bacterium]
MQNKNLKFVFFGTPDLAVYVLEELAEDGYFPSLVVTAPDLKIGRGHHFEAPPVKKWAEAHGIPTLQPKVIDENFLSGVGHPTGLMEYDVFVLTAYGKILPQKILNMPKHGILNVHPSMLPRLRGPSPVRSSILNNERDIGATVIILDEKMDHGPIVAQKNVEIDDKDWPPLLPILEEKLFREGGKLLVKVLEDYIKEKITPKPQDESKATYCEKIKKEDGLVDLLNDSPKEIYTKYCALYGWPGIYFIKNGKRIKITEAKLENKKLVIKKIIPENGKEIDYVN